MPQKKLINEKWFSADIENPLEQVLMGSLCKDCNTLYFPQKRVCPNCMHIDKMVEKQLSKQGILVSFTTSHVGPQGFDPPYAYGWVDLPEDGIRLFSLLTDCEPFEKKLKLDMSVEFVMDKIKTDSDGTELYGYKFRPL
ncbi:MAG: benzoylsuccinyl-CoA thiolase [Desulfobacterales bacterium]|nr:benzoylsuccinyl-CoA thiolase [Desulfobacterales bacterium]